VNLPREIIKTLILLIVLALLVVFVPGGVW
jgi:hypothetical protein